MRGQCVDRRVGAAAAVSRDMRLLPAHSRPGAAGSVKFALMVERHGFGPGPAHQADILLGAAIAGLRVGTVAIWPPSASLPPAMMCTARRPSLSWSSVASLRAATGGATNPGRCARRKLSRSLPRRRAPRPGTRRAHPRSSRSARGRSRLARGCAVSATTPASNAGPSGGISSDATRGAIQPIISTGMATPF